MRRGWRIAGAVVALFLALAIAATYVDGVLVVDALERAG